MLETFKQGIKTRMEEAKRRETAVAANPVLASSPEYKRSQRVAGAIFLVLGAGFTLANYLTYRFNGSVLIISLAANIVFLVAGLYMLISGKNPFRWVKK